MFRTAYHLSALLLQKNVKSPLTRLNSYRWFQLACQLPPGTKEIVFVGGYTLPMQLLQKQKTDGLLDQYRQANIKVRLFIASSFLDKLLPDYYPETWGQILRGFTADGDLIGRAYFDAKQAHLDQERLLTLEETKGILRMVLQQLQQCDVDYYEGNIESFTSLANKEWMLTIDGRSIIIDESAFFWIWYSEPVKTLFYNQPITHATKTI